MLSKLPEITELLNLGAKIQDQMSQTQKPFLSSLQLISSEDEERHEKNGHYLCDLAGQCVRPQPGGRGSWDQEWQRQARSKPVLFQGESLPVVGQQQRFPVNAGGIGRSRCFRSTQSVGHVSGSRGQSLTSRRGLVSTGQGISTSSWTSGQIWWV